MAWSLFLRWSGIPNNLHDWVQNEGHEKTYQLMIANMAMSDLLYPIFLFLWFVAGMYVDSWPVSGRLGPILCKLSWFFPNVSTAVSIQDLILIVVDRFRAVVFAFHVQANNTKKCFYSILATWLSAIAICSPFLFGVKLVGESGKLVCVVWVRRWLFHMEQSTANSNSFKIAQKTAFGVKGRLYTTGKLIQRLFIIDLYT